MNLTICLSAAFLILSHAAFCMPIRGQVKAGNKGFEVAVGAIEMVDLMAKMS